MSKCLALCLSAATLAACGGKDGDNRAPTASFTAPAGIVAGTPVLFVGEAADPDGDTLTSHWSFGDDQKGGTPRIAHVYARAGTYTVVFTVGDGETTSEARHDVVVTEAPAPARLQSVSGKVSTLSGAPLGGVRVVGLDAEATSGDDGSVSLMLGVGVARTLRFSRAGYADQVTTLDFPAESGADIHFDVVMRPRETALNLPSARAGGALQARDGVRIELPASALVDGRGATVSGAVDIAMTPVDVTKPRAGGFPGQFAGVDGNGVRQGIVSFGATEVVLESGGERLQVAAGKTATILIPVYATVDLEGRTVRVGDRSPLWSLDETSGIWIQEGEGEVVASADTPSGLALRAVVSHFSTWNHDFPFEPRDKKPKLKCIYDDDIGIPENKAHFQTATLCNWLAEMDRGIPAQGASTMAQSARPQTERRSIPGFSSLIAMPVEGNIARVPDLPAGQPIVFTVTALNGAFVGRGTMPADSTPDEVVVKMRPFESTTAPGDLVALPFDEERLIGGPLAFRFDGHGFRWVRVTVSGASLTGSVRVFRGSAPLASTPSITTFTTLMPADGSYGVELVPAGGIPATARIRIEELGSFEDESLTLPFLMRYAPPVFPVSLPALTAYRATFTADAARALYIAVASLGGYARLSGPSGELWNVPVDDTSMTRSTPWNRASALPATGSYELTVAANDGTAMELDLFGELGEWAQESQVLTGHSLLDVVLDRDGRPVMLASHLVNSEPALTLVRWTGTTWQSIAPDLGAGTLMPRCLDNLVDASLAFDASNRPVVAYAERRVDGLRVVAKRFDNGWTTLGGYLRDESFVTCTGGPTQIRVDGNDRPIAAVRGSSVVLVSALTNDVWTRLDGAAGADSFAGTVYDLRVDAAGTPYLAHFAAGSGGRVAKFTAGAWSGVGPSDGQLAQPSAQAGAFVPTLTFAANGNPIVASSNTTVLALFRFDGSTWNTPTPYRAGGAGFTGTIDGVTLHGSGLAMAWVHQEFEASGLVARPLVQVDDLAGTTSALGPDRGTVTPYFPHGMVPYNGGHQRLFTIDGVLYQAIESYTYDHSTPTQRVQLLRYVGP